jgi:geranylgeranyl diphosphate synthase type I
MKKLSQFKERFDPSFIAYLKICIDGVVVHHPDFLLIGEHLLKLAGGGKRLRPFMLDLAFSSARGRDVSRILHSMFALELFQLFALIHDDIMDGDTLRHGVETMHVRFDLAQAILVGDLCLVWAMRAINLDSKAESEERSLFMRLSEETMIGQMIDTWHQKKKQAETERIDIAISFKTAKYTFVFPILLGLSFAESGNSTRPVELYTALGEHLGAAFQRLNDLADVLSSEARLGRKPGSDIAADVPTHLSRYFDAHASSSQKAIYAVYRGQPLDHNDIMRVRELFMISGAIEHEKKEIAKILSAAEGALADILSGGDVTSNMANDCREKWHALISHMRSQLIVL